MQSLLDELRPAPGCCDHLIASGTRALVGKQIPDGWSFELAVFGGRTPLNVRLHAAEEASAALAITVLGDVGAVEPVDLSLFVRTCIRRWQGTRCKLIWPGFLHLDPGDPLNVRVQSAGGRARLEAHYSDLRPAKRSAVSEIYRHPLDVPWLYDPLDYEVMIPILKAPGVRRILDLGCGSGRNAVPLENAGYEVHGIDSAPESIRICKHFVTAPERFGEAAVTALPYPVGFFDAMLDVGCLHMLPDRASRIEALMEAARVLKPGGFLCGRALTTRAPDWLAAQPFQSGAAGFNPDEIIEESKPFFEPHILAQTQHLTYYRLLKIA